ncbi:hypothetical protein KIH23_11765 [Flavobacterium sp. CYK-55]|uniref:DUF6266 family protein n=1 Tax=Flavobacterium sp. CYK-55 TaxID=2835529 RepID=UPI001BCCDE53|nr:DUF6266 family protein [Flavobacterium sp. CYK-55]MBS7787974.1 hypothetical protein [Flavobacterium sp. CYK-55]
MATFNKGILGGFSGKVGTVVGASWRGLDVMRSLPKKTNRIASARQLEVQAIFTLTAHFLSPIKPLISDFFGQPSGDKSRYNLAFAYHNREAVVGTYPDYEIDFQKVIIAKGDLLGLQQPLLEAQAGAVLRLGWVDNSGEGEAKPNDALLVVVYNPTRELFAYQTQAALRSENAYVYDLPDTWVGDTVHTWISVADAEGKKCASSVYLGATVLV